MRNQNGALSAGKNIIDGFRGSMGEVDHHMQAVHPAHELFPFFRQPVFFHAMGRSAPGIIKKMGETDIAHPGRIKFIQVAEVIIQAMRPFNTQHTGGELRVLFPVINEFRQVLLIQYNTESPIRFFSGLEQFGTLMQGP